MAEELQEPFQVEELGEHRVLFRVRSRRVPRWPLSTRGSPLLEQVS